MADQATTADLLALTTDIVSSHVANNSVSQNDISGLIEQVYRTLSNLSGGAIGSGADSILRRERPEPAVPVKKSVTPDYIVCLEDGKKLKMLKRHLSSAYGMTPDVYRERWGLPSDYPMTAPNYAKQRSRLAKDIGLGTKSKKRKKA